MARQTNIVSFEEAKASSRRSRARSQQGARTSRRSGSATSRTRESAARSSFGWEEEEPDRTRTRSSSRTSRASRTSSGASSRTSSASSNNASRAKRSSLQFEDDARSSRSRKRGAEEQKKSRSSRTDKRRERTKARADKMYAKQFAAEDKAASVEEGAPRAAVYEGKMGATHRRSSRMQRSSTAGSPSAKVNVAGWLSSLPVSTRSLRVATAVVCVFLFCVLLYPPAQQYYQAQREHDKLAAEYSAIENRNTALDDQNDILASDAGMEDAVRQKFGYVKSGEQVAYVAGLSDEAAAARRDSDELKANVISSTVKAPSEWYTPFLDAFFGVE